MESIYTLLCIALVLLAVAGFIAMLILFVTTLIIKDGGMLIFGYEDDEETIKVQKGNDTE